MAQKKKTLTFTLNNRQDKKHSVRFDENEDEGLPMSSAYVRTDALTKIGNPDKLKVTIEAA